MTKYIVVSTGDFDTAEKALVKRSLSALAAFDTLSEAREAMNGITLLSSANFEPTDKIQEFLSPYKIITIKEV